MPRSVATPRRQLDVSDPSRLHSITTVINPGRALHVDSTGGFVFVADDTAGLSVLDLASCIPPPDALFSDGFETGDTSHWSVAVE